VSSTVLKTLAEYVESKRITTPDRSKNFVTIWYQRINDIGKGKTDDAKKQVAIQLFDYMSQPAFWREAKKEFLRRPNSECNTLDEAINQYGYAMRRVAERQIRYLFDSLG